MFTIGLLTIGAIPTTIGVAEAISAQKKQNAAQKEQAKFHLTARLSLNGRPPMEAWVVLNDGKLWIDHQDSPVEGHKFTGYYFTYPSKEQHRGLVSTIAIDPPMLNWIFADKDSGALRHAGRKETLGHVIGPWGWNADEMYLTLKGSPDCFVAEEDPENKKWSVALAGAGDGASGRDRQGVTEAGSMGKVDSPYDDPSDCDEDDENRGPRRVRIRLRRRMVLGMESKYIKADEEKR